MTSEDQEPSIPVGEIDEGTALIGVAHDRGADRTRLILDKTASASVSHRVTVPLPAARRTLSLDFDLEGRLIALDVDRSSRSLPEALAAPSDRTDTSVALTFSAIDQSGRPELPFVEAKARLHRVAANAGMDTGRLRLHLHWMIEGPTALFPSDEPVIEEAQDGTAVVEVPVRALTLLDPDPVAAVRRTFDAAVLCGLAALGLSEPRAMDALDGLLERLAAAWAPLTLRPGIPPLDPRVPDGLTHLTVAYPIDGDVAGILMAWEDRLVEAAAREGAAWVGHEIGDSDFDTAFDGDPLSIARAALALPPRLGGSAQPVFLTPPR